MRLENVGIYCGTVLNVTTKNLMIIGLRSKYQM